jgi:hypothetical protein
MASIVQPASRMRVRSGARVAATFATFHCLEMPLARAQLAAKGDC